MNRPFQRSGSPPPLGFTLIELMVVVVMIGIMVAVIVPEMRGTLDDALLRATARKLVIAMDLAHSQAITTGSTHRVRIDRDTSRFILERKATEQDLAQGFIPAREVPGSVGELDNRIQVTVTRDAEESSEVNETQDKVTGVEGSTNSARGEPIMFESDGTADPVQVTLRDRQGFRLTLRVNPTTARVRILDRFHE